MMTHSVRFLLRLGDLLGCGLSLSDEELEECVPELLRGSAEDKQKEVRRPSLLRGFVLVPVWLCSVL